MGLPGKANCLKPKDRTIQFKQGDVMTAKLAIRSSTPAEAKQMYKKISPVGLQMTDVPLYVNFFFSWVHPLLVDVVYPKPGFARWICNDFKSASFLQIAALQFVFKCSLHSWLFDLNLEENNMTFQEIKFTS